ncbi:MAG: putative DNA binding domain-containing protein [Anaerolineae bacterium]|nr:putative DNA binding domain-containing protein [Anaerolineae bacterium]
MLEKLIKRGPGQTVAFIARPEANLLAETMVSFANADGGTILLGVNDDGQVIDYLMDDDVEGELVRAMVMCRPPVVTEWEQHEFPDGVVVALKVARSPELHALVDGRVLIRQGGQNRPPSGEVIRHLAATKSSGDFEAEPVPGATLVDLDKNLLDEYLRLRQERGSRTLHGNLQDHLVEIGAMLEDGTPTVAGILLFGKSPQSFLPQSGIIFVKFLGKDARGRDGLAGYGRRVEIDGSLAKMIERAWNVIREEMRVEAVVTGLRRKEMVEYPAFAVREALVNSVCHRDYRLSGRKVEIRMYSDRLEVISPGGLPGYITLDNIVEEHFSRNPRVVSGLFQWGYIEELGLGIDRMIEEMLENGHTAPDFEAKPYSFTVRLHNTREREPAAKRWSTNMNERQMRAMSYVEQNGRITNRDYRQLCPDVNPETIRLDLVDLVDKGLLLKIGDKKGTYYILK